MRDSSVASAVMRSHSLTRRLAMPVKRTGVSLKAASTASVGTASCICEPSITAGRCGNIRMNDQAAASGWVKASIGTPRSIAPAGQRLRPPTGRWRPRRRVRCASPVAW